VDTWKALFDEPVFIWIFSLILTIVMLLWFSKISIKVGLVDQPGGRKKHKYSVPLIGGIGIFCSTTLIFLSLLLSNKPYFGYWLSSFILLCTCILDDRKTLSSKTRLLIQLFSALTVVTISDLKIDNLGNLFGYAPIALGILSVPFTCFSIIGVINAVNMMDGVDGLTGTVSSVEFFMLFLLALRIDANLEMLLIISFLGAIFAFLLFNFPSHFAEKHKLFLGDAGSMLIGLTLSYLCIKLTRLPNGYPPILMIWIMALPIMDTLYLIINRKKRGVPVFKADRRHIHHILLLLNYMPRQTTLILMVSSYAISSLGILLYLLGASDSTLFYGFIIIFILYSMLSHHLKKQIIIKNTSILRTKNLLKHNVKP
jgi:UDP-GlcNAc:undecaprenyl-phosphate GlcNAc-1-phosphate transferase